MPAEVLARTEPTVTVEFADDLPIVHKPNGTVVDVVPPDCDVLVFQRPVHDWMAASIPHFQRHGIRVVVEVDDDFHALDPQNPAFKAYHPALSPHSNWQHLAAACHRADLVTVTTPMLALRYGKRGRSRVVPNFVREELLDIPRAGDGRTVGWAGLAASHPNDLQVTNGGVAMAIESAGARFLNVGTGERLELNLGLREAAETTGWVEMDRYFREIARFDVGIVPLTDTRFNAGKSGLKGLEYGALGVPYVASPCEEYRKLADQGLGVLAGPRSREWRREIKRLLADEQLRAELGDRGREVVREHHLLENNAWRTAEAWAEALT